MDRPIPYGRQFITEEDIKAVTEVLKSDFLTQGPKIDEFEKAFAEYVGSQYAVAVSNGTAALHLSVVGLNVSETSRVITTPITFAATANCVRYCDGEVHFADIDPATYLLDLNKVETLLKSKPKGFFSGLIPVDFSGRAINMQETRWLADRYDLWILQDACHAPGGFFVDSRGEKQFCGNGKFADLAIFSFHPVKHIACGEGGMITTNDHSMYKKLSMLRTHGINRDLDLLKESQGGWYYEMQELGYNYRLTDFQAALGISQLKRANQGLDKRRKIAQTYYQALKNIEGILGQSGVVQGHAYHLYTIEIEHRKGLYDFLKSKNIFTQVHYIPVHTLPYYQQLGWKKGDFPISEKYYSRCLSLPIYPSLTDEEQSYVIESIRMYFAG